MKSLTFILFLITMAASSYGAHPGLSANSQKTTSSADKKLEREILKAENRLGRAISKRDVSALDKLLTDYYADSYEGSDRATSKKTALDHCRRGILEFHRITDHRTIVRRVDIVTVEGVARSERHSGAGTESESETRVKRLWTKKDGRWQLVAQTLEPLDEESER